jgi:eukaryotic-like serine/threonine-protein kinase
MTIPVGTRLGPYEILSAIGAGGMGEVYRAHDARLLRNVAVKVLPEAFARDAQKMARFEREARLLASLNHPNIAAIYGLEESGSIRALVMELVEGPTLADRVKNGPIPLDEALPIAKQIAEAVEYAHENNVIHRDLKPANIKVKTDGTVKVLDFGLAKAMSEEMSEADMSNSPTLSIAATRQGVILGTAAYMSPEQAKGKQVDRRADVWAFGCVLFEMLTGKQAFGGGDITEVFAALVMKEPNFDLLPLGTPASIRNLLRRCLEKDVRGRLQHMGEARIAIERASAPALEAVGPERAALPIQRSFIPAIGALLLGAIIAGGIIWSMRPAVAPQPLRRFDYELPQRQQFRITGFRFIDISPDGRRFLFNATGGIYVREMNQSEAVRIAGTEEALVEPFFSPDGESIGYFQNGQLKRVSLNGGAPVTLCPAGQVLGAAWGRDGNILFSERGGVWRVPANGGTRVRVIDAEPGETLEHPQVLPGSEWILLTSFKGANPAADGDVVLASLQTKERRVLLRGASDARYVPSGYLVYMTGDVLYAAAFDLKALTVSSERVAMLQGVGRAVFNGAGSYAFSGDGSLVYVSGRVAPKKLLWVNRDGTSAAIDSIPAGHYDSPRLSPDGKRVLVWADDDAWIYEIASGRSTRLTSDGLGNIYGEWDPTGAQIAYSSSRGGTIPNAWVQQADGSGQAKKLTDFPGIIHVDSWSHDGKTLAVHFHAPDGGSNLLMLPVTEAKPEAKEFLQGKAGEAATVFSPDGRYVAYYGEETGQGEIYVRPYPGPGGRSTVSVGGGIEPMWAANGELFYRNSSGDRMMSVLVKTQPTLSIGVPKDVFKGRYYLSPSRRSQYDVTANGQRFLMVEADPADTLAARPSINIVLNWFEELKQKVPAK